MSLKLTGQTQYVTLCIYFSYYKVDRILPSLRGEQVVSLMAITQYFMLCLNGSFKKYQLGFWILLVCLNCLRKKLIEQKYRYSLTSQYVDYT